MVYKILMNILKHRVTLTCQSLFLWQYAYLSMQGLDQAYCLSALFGNLHHPVNT